PVCATWLLASSPPSVAFPLVQAEEASAPQPSPKETQPAPRVDLHGDPIPDGALLRMGTTRLRHAAGWLQDAVFAAGGKTLITAAESAFLRVWDPASGKLLRTLDAGRMVTTIALSPDGSVLAAGGHDGIRLFQFQTGKEIRKLKTSGVHSLVFTPDGKKLIS